MGSKRNPRRSRANAEAQALFHTLESLSELVDRTDGCTICASGEACPYHLHDYCRAKNACYCDVFADWADLPSYIDPADILRCAECDQRVRYPWRWVGPEHMTDADLRAVGLFRRGDYFERRHGDSGKRKATDRQQPRRSKRAATEHRDKYADEHLAAKLAELARHFNGEERDRA